MVAEADQLRIEFTGPDEKLLLAEGGRILECIESLLPRAVRALSGAHVRCRVDSGGVRGRREEELRRIAVEAAAEVVRSGEPQMLEPLSSSERRIVHMALAEESAVETESVGSGAERRVVIRPVR